MGPSPSPCPSPSSSPSSSPPACRQAPALSTLSTLSMLPILWLSHPGRLHRGVSCAVVRPGLGLGCHRQRHRRPGRLYKSGARGHGQLKAGGFSSERVCRAEYVDTRARLHRWACMGTDGPYLLPSSMHARVRALSRMHAFVPTFAKTHTHACTHRIMRAYTQHKHAHPAQPAHARTCAHTRAYACMQALDQAAAQAQALADQLAAAAEARKQIVADTVDQTAASVASTTSAYVQVRLRVRARAWTWCVIARSCAHTNTRTH